MRNTVRRLMYVLATVGLLPQLIGCNPDPGPTTPTATTTTTTVPAGVLSIVTSEIPSPVGGVPYSLQLEATGGNGPLVWTQLWGTLPTGLSLGSDGKITGQGDPAEYSPYLLPLQRVQVSDGTSTATKLIMVGLGSTEGFSGTGVPLPDGSEIWGLFHGQAVIEQTAVYAANGSLAAADSLRSMAREGFGRRGVLFSPNGRFLALAGAGLWGPTGGGVIDDSGAVVRTLGLATPPTGIRVNEPRFSADSKWLFVQDYVPGDVPNLLVYNTDTWQLAATIPGGSVMSNPRGPIVTSFSPAGDRIIIFRAEATGPIQFDIYNTANWQKLRTIAVAAADSMSTTPSLLAWSPDSRSLAITRVALVGGYGVTDGRIIEILSTDDPSGIGDRTLDLTAGAPGYIGQVAGWSPQGRLALLFARVIDTPPLQPVTRYDLQTVDADQGTNVRELAQGISFFAASPFSPSGNHLMFTARPSGELNVVSETGGQPASVLTGPVSLGPLPFAWR